MLEQIAALATEAVFSHLLQEIQEAAAPHLRAWLGREPARLAFQTALLRAVRRFAEAHPEWAASLMDEAFFTRDDVAGELAKLLTRRDAPDPERLVEAWAAQGFRVPAYRRAEAAQALGKFLSFLEDELGHQEALRPLFDSRALERIAAGVEALLETLRQQHTEALRIAERSVRIAGDVGQAIIITGDHNTVNYFAAPVRALPTDYAVRVWNFLDEYLGAPDRPVPFGGRARELQELSAWLEDEAVPPYLLLTAPSGRGKSALLARWAAALQRREGLAVAFVPVSLRFNTHLPEVAFAILAAQLARAYQRKPPEKDETPEMWRGFVAEVLRQPPPDGQRVVVVMDGLDEAAGWDPGPDLFPAQPAPGVRVVVSARLTATRPTPDDWLRALGWDRDRARAMTLEGLTREGIAEALASMGFPLDELGRNVDIVAELYRLTEGDPLLVRLYVDDLWARGEEAARLRPEDLRGIRPGYEGYFDRWWEDQRKQWGKEAPLKERAVREVIYLLACALGPLAQEDLLELADPQADLDPLTLGEALRPIARFVVGDRKQGYSLSHPRLGEYFREEVLGAQAEAVAARFAAWARRALAELADGRRAPEQVPRYLLAYGTVHLQRAGDLEALARLVETPAWYAASRAYDPSRHLFAADVERALALAEEQVQKAQCVDRLPHVVAWSLLYATVRTLATHVPVEALEAMTLLGEEERALRYAALITDPQRQAEAYRRIGERLRERGEPERAREALRRALEAAERIGEDSARAEALVAVARALVQVGDREALRRALEAAKGIERDYDRAEALAAVAAALAPVARPQDPDVAAWTVEAFCRARVRGREEVWRHIERFAPVLARLGVLRETWSRLQAVEAVVRFPIMRIAPPGAPPPRGPARRSPR